MGEAGRAYEQKKAAPTSVKAASNYGRRRIVSTCERQSIANTAATSAETIPAATVMALMARVTGEAAVRYIARGRGQGRVAVGLH